MTSELVTSEIAAANVLHALATSCSEPVPAAHDTQMELDDPQVAWFVERGALDVFVAERRADGTGALAAPLAHLLRAGAGRLAFGVEPMADDDLALVAKGLPGSQLRRVPVRMLAGGWSHDDADPDADAGAHGSQRPRTPAGDAVLEQIDAWIEGFSAAVAGDLETRLAPDARLVVGGPVPEGGSVSAERGVVWLAGSNPDAAFLGTEPPSPDGPDLMAVTAATWVDLPDSAAVTVTSSAELARRIGVERLIATALAEFHRLAVGAMALNRRLLMADRANLRRSSSAWRRLDEAQARRGLRAVVRSHTRGAAEGPPLMVALRAVARHARVTVRVPPRSRADEGAPGLQEILDYSGLRRRRVRLAPSDRWWLGDGGALLAFRREDGGPVALLPTAVGRYRVFDPGSGRTEPVRGTTAATFGEDAWTLYRPITPDSPGGAARLSNLLRVAGGSLAADLSRLAVAGLVSGLLTMIPAIAIGALTERLIPAGAAGSLMQFAALLMGVALIAALAHVLRGTAVMRLEGRVATRIGAALMDWVLRVRPNAFRGIPAGELGTQVTTFQRLRDRMAGTAAGAFLSTMFLLPTFVVIFLHSATLGLAMSAIGAAAVIATAAIATSQVGPNRRYFKLARQLSGHLLQFISGIGKLRSARSEGAAFAAWARLYREQKRAEVRVASLSEHIAALGAALPLLAGAAVFAVALAGGAARLPLADLLVVYAVATMFFVSITALGAAFESIAAFAPSCNEVGAVLAAEMEPVPEGGGDVRLDGGVWFDRVSFRYEQEGPDDLTDVTIRAAPGEVVAIVGESGAGKSTLVRLALGLETPMSGGVYYDGHDLSRLDPSAVRRQVGVVTQESGLQPGTILSNIVGAAHDLTVDDAWRAARRAAIDRDIAAMPMGINTPVAENGMTLSGGQRQRVAIAAALVRRPRIIILDEATSWLDATTQQEVMTKMRATGVTRIVIAHRLSTIRDANRIYVLQAGRVVQEGTFEELSAVEGPFLELIRRQIA